MLANAIFLLAALVALFAFHFKRSFQYWQRRGLAVPTAPPRYPFGHMENPFRRSCTMGVLMKHYYDDFKRRGAAQGGLYSFSSPVYLPVHLDSIRNVLARDFNHFVDRGLYYNEKEDPLSVNVFTLGGARWRSHRTKMTPIHTSGKMKMMFDVLKKVRDQMLEALHTTEQRPFDIKEITARYTIDVIGSTAFGLDLNCFKDPQAPFRCAGRDVFAPKSSFGTIKNVFSNAKPRLGILLGIRMFPKEPVAYFLRVFREMVEFRERNNVFRPDLLQLLLNVKNAEEGKNMTLNEIAGEAFAFYLAGFETSSSTMAYCLFELAAHPAAQERVRQEVNRVVESHGEINYEALLEMKYLHQCLEETLRKYPVLPFINRKCVQDYRIPGTDTVVEKGTLVFIPILGLHHDPEYFPQPEKYDPDRFSEENRSSIPPFAFIPFGEGPRMCIGQRFGLMQMKMGISNLIRAFKFSVNEQSEVPLQWNPYSQTILMNTGPLLLDVVNLD